MAEGVLTAQEATRAETAFARVKTMSEGKGWAPEVTAHVRLGGGYYLSIGEKAGQSIIGGGEEGCWAEIVES